ncbi:flagellar export chaperone FliS [Pantoea sp. GL120224-02]|uniref:flagellar export chaperone FliS n=1 Tax=Pantoea sp. GL120224-02 TaxID=1378084 RepID=UPI000BDAF329|nr:flagellar export chaperone FliS [Pantoea sp. GL120224-02]SNY55525.1 flagellar protein FliS [Pantoea sp. GL120224-02]
MYNQSGATAYARLGVESAVMSASQNQLVVMLFDGALSALIRARLFMQEGNVEGRGMSLSKAINIIENGLKQGLVGHEDDELADNLHSLYDYMVRRLISANVHSDLAAVEEVENLLRNIADAWKEVVQPQ